MSSTAAGDKLIQVCGRAYPAQKRRFLFGPAVCHRCYHFLRSHAHQPKVQCVGPPHINAPLVYRPAVQVFHFAAHLDLAVSRLRRGQVNGAGKGQLLFRLAQALFFLRLIAHRTAQIAIQRYSPVENLLLQHHQGHKALHDFEHLRQIIRDQNLGFHRQLRFCIVAAARRGKGVLKHLQFHTFAPFARFWCYLYDAD